MPRLINAATAIGLLLATLQLGAANPVLEGADPHAMVVNGKVWVYPTRSEGGKNFFAFSSRNLKTWKKEGPILDFKDVSWLENDTRRDLGPWAPCIIKKGPHYFFYYSVGPQSPGHPSRIGVARGNSPSGPFKDSGKPLLTGGNGFEAIDPMVFEDHKSGTFYFYAGGSAGSKLRIFELDETMMGFEKEVRFKQPPNFTEAPFIHYENGLYHLTYSHGGWKNATYSVHHATSRSPVGPWRYRGAILTSSEKHKGPGHHSIIEFPKRGDWKIVYHRWNNREGNGPFRGRRETAIDTLTHHRDGKIEPVVMTD